MSEHSEFKLDEHEAFAVMSLFVNRFAERAGDDLITLLTDIRVMDDGSLGTQPHGPTGSSAFVMS